MVVMNSYFIFSLNCCEPMEQNSAVNINPPEFISSKTTSSDDNRSCGTRPSRTVGGTTDWRISPHTACHRRHLVPPRRIIKNIRNCHWSKKWGRRETEQIVSNFERFCPAAHTLEQKLVSLHSIKANDKKKWITILHRQGSIAQDAVLIPAYTKYWFS